MTREEASFYLANMDRKYMEEGMSEALDMAIKALEQEPCDNVCEWFEQYVDIATDIVELRFSDGTVKKAKRGLYLRDIEKSIRKMMIDQIANEKKQESKWIPVSERVPEITIHSECGLSWSDYVLVYGITTMGEFGIAITQYCQDADGGDWCDGYIHIDSGRIDDVLAWMPLPEPYKAESEVEE